LKVVAAQPSGDIDHFAQKKQTRVLKRLHASRIKLSHINPACSDFSLFPAFSACRQQPIALKNLAELANRAIRPLIDRRT
jgi:hypothetical protein